MADEHEHRNDRKDDRAARPGPTRAPVRGGGFWKILIPLALLAGLIWGGAAYLPGLFTGGGADEAGALTYIVGRNPLQVTVTAEGNVESASNIEAKCRVAGGSTILWIVEDGKLVEEGEEIVRLDTSVIDDKLNSQRITYEKALATQIQAQGDLEAATISVKEYEEGTFVELLKQADAGIQIALENLRSAENQLNYSKRMVRKGFVSSLQREADEFAVERAKLDLDAANTRKKVLVDFTRPKTLKDLEAKRDAAAARLQSELAGLQLEKVRLERLQEQLKYCIIAAPKKGMVVYANDSRSRYSSSQQSQVEEGAVVREGQALVRLPDLARMQVKVAVHETRVDQIRAGMPARIVIQDQEYPGKVLSIANQPQSGSWFSANVKEYATIASIEGETSGLRPGMTAKVTILIDDLPSALTVPVSAVVEQRGQFYCWAKTPQGPERRPLVLGRTNDKLIEIADGVKEGDEVFRNPRAVVEEARQEPPFEKQSEESRFGTAGVAESGGERPAAGAPVPAAGSAAAARVAPAAAPAGPGDQGAPGAEAGGERRPAGEPGKRGGRGLSNLMQNDADGDGKLSRAELPEWMQSGMERFDPNGDGFIDAAEIAEMRQRFGSGGGRSGGPGGGRPGGPGGDGSRGGGPEGPP